MKLRSVAVSALFASGSIMGQVASADAATITNGFTFAVASASGFTASGTHFHSNTGGAFGNPAGKAEVGSFASEEVRGLSEYDLAGLGAASSAFVTFDVFSEAGLFSGTNDFAYLGPISISAYLGNNTEDISDYEAASTGFVGTFDTTGLAAGGILSFDITSIFNSAISGGDASLGIRLAIAGTPNGGAFTFDSFRLTTTDDTNTSVVPLPAAAPLLIGALGFLGAAFRRRTRA